MPLRVAKIYNKIRTIEAFCWLFVLSFYVSMATEALSKEK